MWEAVADPGAAAEAEAGAEAEADPGAAAEAAAEADPLTEGGRERRVLLLACYGTSMSTTLRARVRSGRLLLDEPSSLPEGTEVELVPADNIDELEPAERARLHGFLVGSIRKHVSGTGVPADEVLARIRSRH